MMTLDHLFSYFIHWYIEMDAFINFTFLVLYMDKNVSFIVFLYLCYSILVTGRLYSKMTMPLNL